MTLTSREKSADEAPSCGLSAGPSAVARGPVPGGPVEAPEQGGAKGGVATGKPRKADIQDVASDRGHRAAAWPTASNLVGFSSCI